MRTAVYAVDCTQSRRFFLTSHITTINGPTGLSGLPFGRLMIGLLRLDVVDVESTCIALAGL
jgi:hypothetical protein